MTLKPPSESNEPQATSNAMRVDVGQGGPSRAFEVYTDNPFSGRKSRFIVENNQDTDEIDIDFRNATVNIGDPDDEISLAGAQILFLGPSGDTSTAWSILKNGEGPAGAKAMWASRNGEIFSYGYGLTSVYYSVRATADANARFRIQEASGEMRLEWGDGTAAVDAGIGRVQAGVLGLRDVLNFPVAVAAASVPNNSIFLDSADNVLKQKNNSGTVSAL